MCDGSKRTSHSNAYLYGMGKIKKIVLFDTLLKQCLGLSDLGNEKEKRMKDVEDALKNKLA